MAPANLECRSASTSNSQDSPLKPLDASDPDVIAFQTEAYVGICNDTPSYPLADTTDLDIPTDDNYIIAYSNNTTVTIRSALTLECIIHPYIQSSQSWMLAPALT